MTNFNNDIPIPYDSRQRYCMSCGISIDHLRSNRIYCSEQCKFDGAYHRWLERRAVAPWIDTVKMIRKRCNLYGIDFDLDYEWGEQAWNNGRCTLSDIPFTTTRHWGANAFNSYSPSVDRIDNNKGYLKSNTRIILFSVNAFKGRGTDDDMYYIAQRLTNNRWQTK